MTLRDQSKLSHARGLIHFSCFYTLKGQILCARKKNKERKKKGRDGSASHAMSRVWTHNGFVKQPAASSAADSSRNKEKQSIRRRETKRYFTNCTQTTNRNASPQLDNNGDNIETLSQTRLLENRPHHVGWSWSSLWKITLWLILSFVLERFFSHATFASVISCG